MSQLSTITLFLLPWIPAFLCKVTMEEEFNVLEGGSLTIPCHYEPQYASYVKYWCQGRTREFCTSLARTDDHHLVDPAEKKVSVFDDPVQLVFTVTMKELKEGDSGWYICGVEIGGMWEADDTAFTNVKVIHGMLAVNNRMSGAEGSAVTIECLYSERYRGSEKKWCRSGDWRSCLSTGSDGRYEDSSVAIRDDRTGAFTVTFKKLQMKDTAWYWCSAGQEKTAVQVVVVPQPTTVPPASSQSFPDLPPAKPITRETWSSHSPMLASVVVCSSVIFLAVVAILAVKFWRLHSKAARFSQMQSQCNCANKVRGFGHCHLKYSGCPLPDRVPRDVEEMRAKFSGCSREAGDFQNAAVLFLNKDSQDVRVY